MREFPCRAEGVNACTETYYTYSEANQHMAGEHGLDADDMAMYEKPVQRQAIPVYEEFATKEWVYKKNPARSGDKKRIAWMTKSDEEFYFEDYR